MATDILEHLVLHFLIGSERDALGHLYSAIIHFLENGLKIRSVPIALVADRSDPEKARQLYQIIQEKNISLAPVALKAIAHRVAITGDFDLALKIIEKVALLTGYTWKRGDGLAAKILRYSLKHPEGYHASTDILARLVDMGIKITITAYNALIGNAVDVGDFPTAFRVFEFLQEHGIEPDSVTYNVMLTACESCEEQSVVEDMLTKARACIERDRSDRLATNFLHCSLLYHQRFFSASQSSAKWIYARVLRQYLTYFPPYPLFDLGLLDKNDLPSDIVSIIDNGMKLDVDFQPVNIVLMAFLRANTDSDRLVQVYNAFQRNARSGGWLINLCAYDTTYNLFLMAFGFDSKAVGLCPEIVRHMTEPYPTDRIPEKRPRGTSEIFARPTVQTWSILLHVFAWQGHTAAANKVMDLMEQRGTQPDDVTWNILIKGYATANDEEGILEALDNMRKSGFAYDKFTMKAVGRMNNKEALFRVLKETAVSTE
ncbi:hypothetical protein EJ06DRAFT_522689 [Trichodelitschia bisporula]|uniref:Pentacotripeptide-repeat region of PRORP domain-containing protein n=1 Tax=Trichodelitschia bisporula TaxID=703511 RepID=A0A6G1HTI9_9PEZI|nr:hypothetical protein EJ06DRAFT_522689 [Trichodelitschia bisporula]